MGLNMTALQGMYYLISCWILGLNLIRLWTKLGLWFDYVNAEYVHSYFILQVQWVKPVMNIWSEINDKDKKAGFKIQWT